MNNLIRALLEELKDFLPEGEMLDDVYLIANGIEDFDEDHLLNMHTVYRYGDHWLTTARYGNSNGFAFAVVASLLFKPSGELLDWTAYWGGCDLIQRKEDAVRWIARNGNKLSTDDAQHYFPQFPISRYRW